MQGTMSTGCSPPHLMSQTAAAQGARGAGAEPVGADRSGSGHRARVGERSPGHPAEPWTAVPPCSPEDPASGYPTAPAETPFAALARGVCARAQTAVSLDALVVSLDCR